MSFLKKRPYILFIFPAFLLYSAIVIYPIVTTIPYSLFHWGGFGQPKFVGLGNYKLLFGNISFLHQITNASKNVAILMLINFFITNPVTIILAYMLFREIRGSKLYTTVLFMPQFINTVSITFILTLFFAPDLGIYSFVMQGLGVQNSVAAVWYEPKYGLILLTIANIWRGIGYTLLLYIANYKMISAELDEAAKIDGVGEIKRFLYIYLPLSAPTFINIIILNYIWTLTMFDMPYLLGGKAGGLNGCMDTLQLFFYRTVFGTGALTDNFIGLGATIASCILVLLIVGSVGLQRLLKRFEVDF